MLFATRHGGEDHRPRALPARTAWPVVLIGRGANAREANGVLTRSGVAPEPSDDDDRRAAALVLSTLSATEREALRRALEDLALRLEVRANPTVEDLDDSDPTEVLARMMRSYLPALTAGDAVASRRRAASDGLFVTAIAMQCPPDDDAGATCVPLWRASPPDRAAARGRFLEWPLAAAIVLGFATENESRVAAEVLRARSHEAGSHIALVLTEADLADHDDPRLESVRAPARRALAIARRDPRVDARMLEFIVHEPPPGGRLIPWLRLDREEVLVVPRLGALARLDLFVHEVEGERDLGSMEWVRRPDPMR